MKKILFLLLIFFIKLNAYEYRIYIARNGVDEIYYFDNSNGFLKVRYNNVLWNDSQFYSTLNSIKVSRSTDGYLYIRKDQLIQLFKQNNQFLNDFYTQQTQAILNFFYNDNIFTYTNHIVYDDYELLYDSNGLAVESIVDGKWSGLYEDSGQSGYLYNEKGDLLYVNGEPASFLEKINNRLLKRFKINLESIFIKKIFYPLLVLIFACVVLRSVIRLALQSFLIRFYDKKISQLEKRREKIENA